MKRCIVALLVVSGCHHYEENLGFTVVGEPRWAVSVGGSARDRALVAAFDSIGDVVVAGEYFGPADFGGGLMDVGGPWTFITKRVGSDGAERWTRRLFGLNSRSRASIGAMAVTPQDEIVVTGSYYGSVDFGGQILALEDADPPSYNDMFLAKYASDGQLLWVRGFAERSNVRGTALAVDASGAIYATATFWSCTFAIDGQIYREADGDHDAILFAYDSDGTRRWSHVLQGAAGPYARSIALVPNGDVLVGGSFGAPTSLGGAVLQPEARVRGFMTRFRNDGLYLASTVVGPPAPYTSWGPDIRVSASGQIVLQQVEVDEGVVAGASWPGSTLRVHGDDGAELWGNPIANHGMIAPQERTLLATSGGLIGSAAWTDDVWTGTGHMEVLTFEADGSHTVSTFGRRLVLTNGPVTFVFGSAVSSSGAIVFTGQFGGTLDFGTGPMTSRGQDDTDAFIVVVDPPVANAH